MRAALYLASLFLWTVCPIVTGSSENASAGVDHSSYGAAAPRLRGSRGRLADVAAAVRAVEGNTDTAALVQLPDNITTQNKGLMAAEGTMKDIPDMARRIEVLNSSNASAILEDSGRIKVSQRLPALVALATGTAGALQASPAVRSGLQPRNAVTYQAPFGSTTPHQEHALFHNSDAPGTSGALSATHPNVSTALDNRTEETDELMKFLEATSQQLTEHKNNLGTRRQELQRVPAFTATMAGVASLFMHGGPFASNIALGVAALHVFTGARAVLEAHSLLKGMQDSVGDPERFQKSLEELPGGVELLMDAPQAALRNVLGMCAKRAARAGCALATGAFMINAQGAIRMGQVLVVMLFTHLDLSIGLYNHDAEHLIDSIAIQKEKVARAHGVLKAHSKATQRRDKLLADIRSHTSPLYVVGTVFPEAKAIGQVGACIAKSSPQDETALISLASCLGGTLKLMFPVLERASAALAVVLKYQTLMGMLRKKAQHESLDHMEGSPLPQDFAADVFGTFAALESEELKHLGQSLLPNRKTNKFFNIRLPEVPGGVSAAVAAAVNQVDEVATEVQERFSRLLEELGVLAEGVASHAEEDGGWLGKLKNTASKLVHQNSLAPFTGVTDEERFSHLAEELRLLAEGVASHEKRTKLAGASRSLKASS